MGEAGRRVAWGAHVSGEEWEVSDMSAPEDVLRLRAFYEEWAQAPVVFEFGPIKAWPSSAAPIQAKWRDIVDPAVAGVISTCVRSGNVFAYRAPSAWHAYFFLRAQHGFVFRRGVRVGESPPVDAAPVGEHLFFRGQCCSSWEFTSSLSRKTPPERDLERRAVAVLTAYFRTCFVANDEIARISGICFAQHYGIATDLIDVSCDPAVAVWFASQPSAAPCPNGESEGIVRAISWASQALVDSLPAVFLPPPFVRNLYQQRGLFIDSAPSNSVLRGGLCLEVRFPRTIGDAPFQVWRTDGQVDVWPEPDEAELELIEWARRLAQSCSSEAEVSGAVEDAWQKNSMPKFWLSRRLFDFEGHIGPWLGALDWVLPGTCITGGPAPPGANAPFQYEVLDSKVQNLVRANAALFRGFVGAATPEVWAAQSPYYWQVLKLAADELGMSLGDLAAARANNRPSGA
jgi:hypothetical protein